MKNLKNLGITLQKKELRNIKGKEDCWYTKRSPRVLICGDRDDFPKSAQ